MTRAVEPGDGASVGLLDGTSDRARLMAAGLLVLSITALHRIEPLLVAVALALGLAIASGCSLSSIVHRLRHVEGFLALLLLVLPFSVAGDAIAAAGPLTASWQGLAEAAIIALKVNAAALVILALVTRLEPGRLGRALAGLGFPAALTHLLVLTVRYVAVFRAEYARLVEAMRARGFVACSSRHTWISLGNLAGMMLVRSIDRAERVEEAMRARGFSGRMALHDSPPFTAADYAMLAGALIVALGLAGAQWL
jgi:cobalt/nickel transport system permease protein